MLRLDPDDELDVSHAALSFQLELGNEESDRAAGHVMGTHPCDCAHHLYADLLLHYRRHGGEDERTKRALVEAIGSGPPVGPFLYGAFPIPEGLPPAEELAGLNLPGIGGPDAEDWALLRSAATAAELEKAWVATPGAREWLGGVFRDLAKRVEGVVGEPDSPEAQVLAGTGAAGLSRVLGLSDDIAARTGPGTDVEADREGGPPGAEAEAGFLFWREREEEDAALSRFKDALAALIEDRARKIGLELEKGTAPFPVGLDPLGGLPDVSPLSYLAATGPKGGVADLADALLEMRVADFTLFAEDPRTVEELRSLGAEVLRGPARGFLAPDPENLP